MQLFKIQGGLIQPSQDILPEIMVNLARSGIAIENDDILAITSKVVSLSQNRIVKLDTVKPSTRAFQLAKKHNLDPEYVELILTEADEIYGGTDQALCTIKDGIMIANAGIDRKNIPSGYAVLYPEEPHKVADTIRKRIHTLTGKFIGVLIVDSRVTPLRLGTVGVALGFAGFDPVYDWRGFKDLYGKPLLVTRHCKVDDLAGAAHLLMGELDEKIIAVLIKGAPIKVFRELSSPIQSESVKVPPDSCIFISALYYERENNVVKKR
jgi:coenzyme F420-0:L-glutamate ligase/coenzyme F420-1:gamma-L-glutamate ligase